MNTLAEVQLEIGGKYCSGYKGVCYDGGLDTYLPLDKFSGDKKSHDGKQSMCKKCHQVCDAIRWTKRPKHPVTGEVKRDWKYRIAKSMGGIQNTLEWKVYLDKAEVAWDDEVEKIEAEAWLGTIFPKSYEPKPLRTVLTTVKPRNTSLVTYLKERYNYTCQVRGCSEQEVDVAHLHPHRYKDSVDNETNATVLCKNHHWSLDHRRMYIEDNLSFTRYNLDGKIIEMSIIECHEDHNIDAKFITKSQDWFLGGADDRKEQAVD
jgi:hypothetical protein